VDPRVILAQAALETAWGRSILGSHSGVNSHNLFGIKASNWNGAAILATTHEYYDGLKVKEDDAFRSYDSYADSFADYIGFLQKNPRYHSALANAHDPWQFTKALQEAGYATDPYYAQKIMQIFNSEPIQRIVP
jgi:flagellar protein FlgJ